MNETLLSFFFKLIQLGIGTRESLHLETPLPESTWKELLTLTRKQAVTGIVMDGILKLPAEYLPPTPIKLKGIQQLLRIEQLNRRLNGEAVQVSEFLQAEGYACTILKGQGIARYYPNPLHRMPGDIDVWPDAEPDVLRKYGHTRFPDKEWTLHHTHLPLLDETEVELHFQPSYMYNPVTNRRLLAFCRKHRKACAGNQVLLEGTGRQVAVATDTFNRVYVLQHIMRHLFSEGIGLRQLTDYALVLRKGMPPAEKEETMQTLRRLHMEGFAGAVMYVLQTVFTLEPEYLLRTPDERKGKLLLEEILEGGNFGHYDQRGNKQNLPNKVKKRVHKFLRVFSLAPSEAVWSFLFFTRAFFLRRWHRLKLSNQLKLSANRLQG
ncbi:nucleotidyltransferase family protein [uncultured Phocaeicola sp.]|uniref:nucleotidyltransferase family protein n=1 Tax=uncultured Phocaeicola sp. TaxID=990718 RepID=UPI0025D5A0D7|nr:nucleotidyltransferase family protein [uncultured Phocaeicola sp.]